MGILLGQNRSGRYNKVPVRGSTEIVFFTHWSIFAQNCGLIRPSFPVVIIKLGCCTCRDSKRNMAHLKSG